jgi:hypothetical protein
VLIDEHAAEVQVKGGDGWQEIVLRPQDFHNHAGDALANWQNIKRLKLSDAEHLRPARGQDGKPRLVGKHWQGSPPRFRNLRWHVAAATNESARSPILDVFPDSVAEVPAEMRRMAFLSGTSG